MESPFAKLTRSLELTGRMLDWQSAQAAAAVSVDGVPGLVEEARRQARALLDGTTSTRDAVHAVHLGPVALLGHPPALQDWCDLDHGRWQDPTTLRLVEAVGPEGERAAREVARRLLDRDVAALVGELEEHVRRDEALRPGALRAAMQIFLTLLLVAVPVGFVWLHVAARMFPRAASFFMVAAVMALLAHLLARSLSQGSASSVRGVSKGADIVLLRPFGEDAHPGEATLVAALGAWGTVTAIGQPGDRIPPLGAQRVYLGSEGEGWKAIAARLVQSAELVVVRLGPTVPAGLRWELEYLIAHEDPSRVVLALPESLVVYERFRAAATGIFPLPLPPAGPERPRGLARLRRAPPDDPTLLHHRTRFLAFDSGWSPVQIPSAAQARSLKGGASERIRGMLDARREAAAPPDLPPLLPLPEDGAPDGALPSVAS